MATPNGMYRGRWMSDVFGDMNLDARAVNLAMGLNNNLDANELRLNCSMALLVRKLRITPEGAKKGMKMLADNGYIEFAEKEWDTGRVSTECYITR